MSAKTETKLAEFHDDFVANLEELVETEDRGALATLRRGLGKEFPFEIYRFMPFKRKQWHEDAALLVGPLFALWHQGKDEVVNAGKEDDLGTSMRDLVARLYEEDSDPDRRKAWERAMKRVERRFSALLNCHQDDLRQHLRHAVSLLKSKEVPVNWRLLCEHIQQWNHEKRWVQRNWARSFWSPRTQTGEAPEADAKDEGPEGSGEDNVVD